MPGRFKGPAFKRGHVIRPEDVNRLRDLGKENIAALDLAAGWLHEDDAAHRLATAAAGIGEDRSVPTDMTTITAAKRMISMAASDSVRGSVRKSDGNPVRRWPPSRKVADTRCRSWEDQSHALEQSRPTSVASETPRDADANPPLAKGVTEPAGWI